MNAPSLPVRPCPSCFSDDVQSVIDPDGDWRVVCTDCGCSGPWLSVRVEAEKRWNEIMRNFMGSKVLDGETYTVQVDLPAAVVAAKVDPIPAILMEVEHYLRKELLNDPGATTCAEAAVHGVPGVHGGHPSCAEALQGAGWVLQAESGEGRQAVWLVADRGEQEPAPQRLPALERMAARVERVLRWGESVMVIPYTPLDTQWVKNAPRWQLGLSWIFWGGLVGWLCLQFGDFLGKQPA